MLMVITNDNTRELGGSKKNPAGNGFSYYLIFSDLNPHQIKKDWLKIEGGGDTPLLDGTPITSVAELVGKLKGTLVRLGPDLLELMEALTPEQKPPSENETPETRQASTDAITDQDLQEVGLTREEFEALTTAFADEAHIANIIKKLASANPEK
ncbi:32770_t:CDS:1, partial [Racocetra persica]